MYYNNWKRKVKCGDDVAVSNPKRFIPDATCIIGDVVKIQTRKGVKWATIKGDVGRMGGGYPIEAAFRYEDLSIRLGTPISKIWELYT